jgi:DIM1 family U5 snRNP protein
MAYLLPHLHSGWEVDQAIITEEDRVVAIRFGRDQDPTCMIQDEILMNIAEKVKNFAVIYVVDIDEVPDFNNMYELFDDCTTMFFYRNKHIMVDLGTGNNNKINWALADKQEMIDIIEVRLMFDFFQFFSKETKMDKNENTSVRCSPVFTLMRKLFALCS